MSTFRVHFKTNFSYLYKDNETERTLFQLYGLILQKNATCFKEIVEESYLKPLCVIKHTSSCFCSSDYHLSNSREAVDVSLRLYIVLFSNY